MVAKSKPAGNGRSGTKSKGGCKTCKIRKVRCDGGRPACHKCASTGRTCDGYGIWGGGSADPSSAVAIASFPTLKTKKLSSIAGLRNATEAASLDWFICRSATKIPGVFGTDFWSSIVFQAVQTEPAILHAALALSSAHRGAPNFETTGSVQSSRPDVNEQFLLRHYSESVRHLQPHFQKQNDKSSMRVALITSILLTCLEFLRGHYETGKKHLLHGNRILGEIQNPDLTSDTPTDQWLAEALSRLSLPALFLGDGARPRISLVLSSPPLIFASMGHARQMLDALLQEVTELWLDRAEKVRMGLQVQDSPKFAGSQQRLRVYLQSWFTAYVASRVNLQTEIGVLGFVAYQTLGRYHSMAKIILETCSETDCQMCFDDQLPEFLSILRGSIDIYAQFLTLDLGSSAFAHKPDIPPFVADRSFLLPLYYTAIKCRNHRIRYQAIKLLGAVASREGIMDAILFSEIASEVMRIEEGDFYANIKITKNDFSSTEVPTEADLDFPILPEANRIQDVRITLPDSPGDVTILICIRGDCTITRKYDPIRKCWTNV